MSTHFLVVNCLRLVTVTRCKPVLYDRSFHAFGVQIICVEPSRISTSLLLVPHEGEAPEEGAGVASIRIDGSTAVEPAG